MREAVLNSDGFSVKFASRDAALDALDHVASALLLLSARKHIAFRLWMRDQPYSTIVCKDMSLIDLFRDYLGRDKDRAIFLLRMATKCPIDDGVEAVDLESFLNEEIEGGSHCTDLLWCAISGTKVAVSLSPDEKWHRNPLSLRLVRNGTYTRTVDVENIFSTESAEQTAARLDMSVLCGLTPGELWQRRGEIFPSLIFGLDVEKQLRSLGADVFESAIARLSELNRAASDWGTSSKPVPEYLSKVTGESTPTMQKFGGDRIFRSSCGSAETFEKHARLHNGARIHLREIVAHSAIEIGYIGVHLRTVSDN